MKRTAIVVALIAWIGAVPGTASQQDALAQLREALGGETALSAVRTLRVRSTINRQPHKDHVEVVVALPDRFFRTVRYMKVPELPRGSAPQQDLYDVNALNLSDREGPGVLMSGFNGPTPLPESRYQLERSPAIQRQRLDGAHARFAELVLPLFGNTSAAYPVEATSAANSITFRATVERSWLLTLDPVTHLPHRMTWTGPAAPPGARGTAPADWQVDFSDFKPVNGLRWPHRLIKSRNGTVDEDSTIERYEVNLKLSEKAFRQ